MKRSLFSRSTRNAKSKIKKKETAKVHSIYRTELVIRTHKHNSTAQQSTTYTHNTTQKHAPLSNTILIDDQGHEFRDVINREPKWCVFCSKFVAIGAEAAQCKGAFLAICEQTCLMRPLGCGEVAHKFCLVSKAWGLLHPCEAAIQQQSHGNHSHSNTNASQSTSPRSAAIDVSLSQVPSSPPPSSSPTSHSSSSPSSTLPSSTSATPSSTYNNAAHTTHKQRSPIYPPTSPPLVTFEDTLKSPPPPLPATAADLKPKQGLPILIFLLFCFLLCCDVCFVLFGSFCSVLFLFFLLKLST